MRNYSEHVKKLSLRGTKRRGNLMRLLHFVRNDTLYVPTINKGRWMKDWWRLVKLTLYTLLSLNLTLSVSFALAQYFTINKFHSDIMIHEDSSIIVKEAMDVEFHQSRHGIYRELPFKYRDEFGKVITTPIRVLSVTDDSGKAWKYQVKKAGPMIHIRIGDAKRYV